MQRYGADIVGINETWLKQNMDERAPVVPGYKLRHVPRPPALRGRGGGIGFYIKNGISTRIRKHPVSPTVEQMWLSCTVNSIKLLIGTAYRPEWLDINTFFDALTDSVTSFSGYDQLLLMGDFNIDLLTNNNKTALFKDFLHSVGLTQTVQQPTHFANDHSEKVKGSSKKYFELDTSDTLAENLSGKCVVEFPIIVVALKDHAYNFDIITPEDEFAYQQETEESKDLQQKEIDENAEQTSTNDLTEDKSTENGRRTNNRNRNRKRPLFTQKIAKEKSEEIQKEIEAEKKKRPKNLLFTTGYSSEESLDLSDDEVKK
ncbi:unnamed protein product [Plutella xylostella]|uniref:(diamondback moth) hypothetical protein n=1 Tax=Plutella xylostella TaxID=51655 RepID=A0A8S4EWC6_PLUXY|nr:unnamed protein product [Plutella xylostella]